MRKFFIWLFRTALFIVGLLAFLMVIGESTEVAEPWYFFPLKLVAIVVIVACYKAWWWSLSPAEKAEFEKEEA